MVALYFLRLAPFLTLPFLVLFPSLFPFITRTNENSNILSVENLDKMTTKKLKNICRLSQRSTIFGGNGNEIKND